MRLLLGVFLILSTVVAPALDNTISNEFWCTKDYVNASPVCVATMDFETDLNSFLSNTGNYETAENETIYCRTWTVHWSQAISVFNSCVPAGCMLIMR
jgi:hypothetical protein